MACKLFHLNSSKLNVKKIHEPKRPFWRGWYYTLAAEKGIAVFAIWIAAYFAIYLILAALYLWLEADCGFNLQGRFDKALTMVTKAQLLLGHNSFGCSSLWGTSWGCCFLMHFHAIVKFGSAVVLAGALFASLKTGRRRGYTIQPDLHMKVKWFERPNGSKSIMLSTWVIDLRSDPLTQVKANFFEVQGTELIPLETRVDGSLETGLHVTHEMEDSNALISQCVRFNRQILLMVSAFDPRTGPTAVQKLYVMENMKVEKAVDGDPERVTAFHDDDGNVVLDCKDDD